MNLTKLLALILFIFLKKTEGAKILSISFLSAPSRAVVSTPLLHRLAEKGHHVTVVSSVKTKAPPHLKNLQYIHTIDLATLQSENTAPNFFELKESKIFETLGGFLSPFFYYGKMMETICRRSYDLPFIKDLISGKEKYDAILFSHLFNDCVYGLIHHMNMTTKTILISEVSVLPWIASSFGTPSPPSFVPLFFLPLLDHMTIGERFINFIGVFLNEFARTFVFNPKMEKVYREVIDLNLPSVEEIEKNVSSILCSSHVSFTPPRPLMPDIIDVGGMHLKNSEALPKDLAEFLQDSDEHGFILFSMGSALKGSNMPEKYRQIFLQTFASLKQKVIWKWETEMEDLPENIKLSKWLPQHDVLGHPNIKLFITHGGHGSTTESIFFGVPILGLPMFADQKYNINIAVKKQLGVSLEFTSLTQDNLREAIDKVINETSYKNNVKKLSAIFRDQITDPLEKAVYHVEYILRHNGAQHLRSAGRDLGFIQYYSLDVIGLILSALIMIIYVEWILIKILYRKCFVGNKTKIVKESGGSKKLN